MFYLSAEKSGDHVPPPPESAHAVFGSALPLAVRYAGLLADAGVRRGLIGPAEASRVWERHLLNCAVVADLVPVGSTVVDLGSGAGLPGLVLALMLPKSSIVLVEPMARRTAFLAECVRELDLPNVDVERARAEELAGQVGADVVTARAVAGLDRLAGLAAGLARPGGLVLAIKGASAAREISAARGVMARMGVGPAEIVLVGEAVLDHPTTVVRFRTGRARAAASDRCHA